MASDVQPDDPPAELLDVARQVAPAWLRRVTVAACPPGLLADDRTAADLDAMVAAATDELLERLGDLLDTDVDEQRTTPLSLFREATGAPEAWLRAHGVAAPAPPGDGSFRDDPYRLGPATWVDVDPTLHEPGLRWGAWKAMTVLGRRRDEGLR